MSSVIKNRVCRLRMLICRVVGRQSITKWNLANVSPLQQLKSVKANVTCTVVAASVNNYVIYFSLKACFMLKYKTKILACP